MVLNPQPYTIKRYKRSVVDHVMVEVEDDEFTVYGNLQPMTDRELKNFGEGFRTSPGKKWKFYVDINQPLLKIGGPVIDEDNEPDRIMYDGRVIYVHGLEDQSTGVLPHRKWICREAETEVGGVDLDA